MYYIYKPIHIYIYIYNIHTYNMYMHSLYTLIHSPVIKYQIHTLYAHTLTHTGSTIYILHSIKALTTDVGLFVANGAAFIIYVYMWVKTVQNRYLELSK